MCGIAGLFTNDRAAAETAVARMLAALAHRGPDDRGAHVEAVGGGVLGLGQTRLAIVDLSPAGHQPMRHGPTGNWLVFNGEIYGFQALRARLEAGGARFRGTSDTEVLLEALTQRGDDALSELDGMYALAYFDARRQRLLLARDPLGIKPLYVTASAGRFAFASEIRALLVAGASPRTVDRAALARYLAFGAFQEPETPFTGIRAFPRGTAQWIDLEGGAARRGPARRVWQAPVPDPKLTMDEAVAGVERNLTDAVRTHLVSDVPLGIFLSSGMDSAIIGGLAARLGADVLALTVSFREPSALDEGRLAAATAARLGLRHREVMIGVDDSLAASADWLAAMDQPSFDGLNTYIVSRAAHAEGLKVALTGLGADELFGGYPAFVDVPRQLRILRRVPRGAAAALFPLLTPALRLLDPTRAEKLADTAGARRDVAALYMERRRCLSRARLAALGLSPDGGGPAPELAGGDAAWTISQLESTLYMGNMLLKDLDGNSMAHGLELRVPFLGRAVIDAAARLPERLRMPPGGRRKELLWRAFHDLIRPELAGERKKGFSLPVADWMRGPLSAWRVERLHYLGKTAGIFEPRGVDAVLQAFLRKPDGASANRVYALAILGDYLERHAASAP